MSKNNIEHRDRLEEMRKRSLREVSGIVTQPVVLPNTKVLRGAIDVDGLLLSLVVGILEGLNVGRIVDIGPNTNSLLVSIALVLLSLTIEEEGTETTSIELIRQAQQQVLIELEDSRELAHDLVDTIQEEKEDRGTLTLLEIMVISTSTKTELMTETTPSNDSQTAHTCTTPSQSESQSQEVYGRRDPYTTRYPRTSERFYPNHLYTINSTENTIRTVDEDGAALLLHELHSTGQGAKNGTNLLVPLGIGHQLEPVVVVALIEVRRVGVTR